MTHSFLKSLDPGQPAILLMRHAERFPITDVASSSRVLLTAKGKSDAQALGRLLAGRFGLIRLYHSPVERCLQTADGLLRGIREKGGSASLEGPLAWLGGDFIRAEVSSIDGRIGTVGLGAFMRQWFDKTLSEDMISSPDRAARIELGFLHGQLDGREGLIIDVTHDWNIMLLTEHYLALRHEEIGFPAFLDCLIVTRTAAGGIALQYRGDRVEADDWL